MAHDGPRNARPWCRQFARSNSIVCTRNRAVRFTPVNGSSLASLSSPKSANSRNAIKMNLASALGSNFVYVLSCGTNGPAARLRMELLAGGIVVHGPPVILIVEDDALIQDIVDDALREGGFETAIAPSAEEALTLLRGKVVNYRALVADITLKGRVNGWEVAKQAREIDPAFPIVYMTGAAANDWASHGVPNSILLEKPFAPAQILTAISQLLNAAAPAQS